MEEKILIKSNPTVRRKLFIFVIVAITLIAIIVPSIMLFSLRDEFDASVWEKATEAYDKAAHKTKGYCYHITAFNGIVRSETVKSGTKMWTCPLDWSSSTTFAFSFSQSLFQRQYGANYYTYVGIGLGISVLLSVLYLWLRCYELVVTDKRVYGRAAFGKRVDLPMDSISAVGTMWLKGISVATSSGRIGFLMIKNRDEIHKCISELLISRQPVKTEPIIVAQATHSNADELRKYKDLLDSGIITQEEFDAKKKQLLGL